MKKFLGTAKLTNLIRDRTRKLEPKRRNQCEGVNGQPPHTPTADEKPLGFSHNPWRSRLAILQDCLIKYREGGDPITSETIYYIPDLDCFEQEFIEAHLPWENSGKILCKRCDREWTATGRAPENGATPELMPPAIADQTSGTATGCPAVETQTNIQQLTVELIYQRLTNAEVLAGVRKVFPGRASMNTVAWYRSHLIHDRSTRFDKLRAGRIPPASAR